MTNSHRNATSSAIRPLKRQKAGTDVRTRGSKNPCVGGPVPSLAYCMQLLLYCNFNATMFARLISHGIQMALINCHECSKQISSEAEKCPHCGVVPKTKKNVIAALVGLAAIAFFFGYYVLKPNGERTYFEQSVHSQAEKDMADISRQVATDAERQYNIAKQHGTDMDKCVQAMSVSAAFLQAKDDISYAKWKRIEKADCQLAGLQQ
jgi:hypothetical protein